MDEPKILVAIRKRPLSKKEQSKGQTDIISVKNQETVIVSQYKQKVDLTKYLEETVFNFDFAFDQMTTNEQIYYGAVRPLVDSAFQGAKVTCFAYGQTGSGKTFTMNGNSKMGVHGLYTLGASDIFGYLNNPKYRHLTARLSFFQIYCGKLFDLLNKRTQLTLRQDNKSNINIIGLEQNPIDSLQKFQQLLAYGSVQRVTSQNSANSQSSRSHAILQVTLKQGKKVYGKISFIDLAGNERGADHTDMKKQTRIDGAEINKSLLSLKQCIRALDQGKGHTPFRGSKLTMVLKDSFVGFCRTIMIGNVSPSSASSQNTLNTLRYADRVKQLRKPTEGLTKQELKARQMMLPRQNNNAIKIQINKDDDAEDIEAKRKQAQKVYGIKQQSPPKQVRDVQRQMSSDPYRKGIDTDRGRQQSFGGPTSLNRPLLQGVKQPQPLNNIQPSPITSINQTLQNQKGQQPLQAPKSPNLGKINIPNVNQAQGKTQIASQRNFAQNNNNSSPQYQQEYVPPSFNKVNSVQINGPKHIQQTRMDIEGAGMTNSQILNRQNNNFFNNNSSTNYNQQQYQQQQQLNYGNNNVSSQYYSMNQNQNQGYKQDNQYQNPNLQYANQGNQGNQGNYYQNNITNRIMQNQAQNDGRLNQYRTQYQQPDQRPHSASREQIGAQGLQRINQYKPPPPKVIIPEDFEGMVEFVSTTNDPTHRQQVHQKLHEQLFNEQNQLIASHSDTLRSSLDYLKSQMSLIADLQNNRDAVSTRQYLGLMQQSIDQKISLLQILREKMLQFSYKLERVQQIDEQNQNVGPRNQDQQLLDDLH